MALDLSRLRFLIVDDNAFMRRLLRELLWALDCAPDNIRFASNGRDALQVLRDYPIDIVFCDINMRPMNGREFTSYIRMAPASPDPHVPIIVCTGHAEMEHICGARDAGANEILRKPITANSVYERVRAIIERPRPFVRSSTYFGPDRRRRDLPFDGPDRRHSVPVLV
jgi:two-component system, chemotaxis family, chemotaxis protein CheY